MQDEVKALARERDAVIVAHNYQVPAVQDVADYVGDSLELSRISAQVEEPTIVFCGVHFMAETAKILSYDKTVLIPDQMAGCALAASITVDELKAWKAEHPGATTIMYVNTAACCEIRSRLLPHIGRAKDHVDVGPGELADQEILFRPRRVWSSALLWTTVTGARSTSGWASATSTPASSRADIARAGRGCDPIAEFLVHPECGCSSQCMYLASTGDLPADRTFIVGPAASSRMKESLGRQVHHRPRPGSCTASAKRTRTPTLIAADEAAVCGYMKMITLEKLRDSLRDWKFEVEVEPEVAAKARLAIQRMVEIG